MTKNICRTTSMPTLQRWKIIDCPHHRNFSSSKTCSAVIIFGSTTPKLRGARKHWRSNVCFYQLFQLVLCSPACEGGSFLVVSYQVHGERRFNGEMIKFNGYQTGIRTGPTPWQSTEMERKIYAKDPLISHYLSNGLIVRIWSFITCRGLCEFGPLAKKSVRIR